MIKKVLISTQLYNKHLKYNIYKTEFWITKTAPLTPLPKTPQNLGLLYLSSFQLMVLLSSELLG